MLLLLEPNNKRIVPGAVRCGGQSTEHLGGVAGAAIFMKKMIERAGPAIGARCRLARERRLTDAKGGIGQPIEGEKQS